jgi:hypothetical protein
MENLRFFGCDPEFFIYEHNKETEYGNIPFIIPPASLFTDYNIPFTLSPNNKRILLEEGDFRFIEDGAALELNLKRPIKNTMDFNQLISFSMERIREKLYEIFINKSNYSYSRLKLAYDVLGYFSIDKYWKNRDKTFHDCVRFGCDPDIFPEYYLISGFEENTCKEIDARNHEYRYAGGHLHIQNMSDNPDIYYKYVELAPIIYDFFVGTTNVLIRRTENILQQEFARLKYYGRPGRIRLQKYSDKVNGIEYRPPSNQWINNPFSVDVMFNAADVASNIIEYEKAEEFFSTFQDRIYELWKILTNHDKIKCKQMLLDSFEWAFDNHLATISQLEKAAGKNGQF